MGVDKCLWLVCLVDQMLFEIFKKRKVCLSLLIVPNDEIILLNLIQSTLVASAPRKYVKLLQPGPLKGYTTTK